MTLYKILQLFMAASFLAALIVGIIVTKTSKNVPAYMKYFYWYPAVGVVVVTILLLKNPFNVIPSNIAHLIDNYSILFHFGFLSLFLFQKIIKGNILKHYKAIIAGFLIIILISLVCFDSNPVNNIAYSISNTGLLVICGIYFMQLTKQKADGRLAREPFFWIASGIFFGMALSIPILITCMYFYRNLPYSTYITIVALAPFSYFIMYLFFIKAYLCIIRLHKQS